MYACYNVYRRAVSDHLQPDSEVADLCYVECVDLVYIIQNHIDYYMMQNKATVIQNDL